MDFTYDDDGWCSGYNQADAAAGRVTNIEPEIYDGCGGYRWNGIQWLEHNAPSNDASCDVISEARYDMINSGLAIMKVGKTTRTVNSDPQSRDTIRRLAQDFGAITTISPAIVIKDFNDDFFEVASGADLIDANGAIQGDVDSLEQTLYRMEKDFDIRVDAKEFKNRKAATTAFGQEVLAHLQVKYDNGDTIACPVCLAEQLTQGE